MKITFLCENSAGIKHYDTCLAEWGLSAYIEVDDIKILFDTGTSFVYQHNAKILNIDLNKIDFIVLSHNHLDHTGGLCFHQFKEKKKMIIHPQILEKMPHDLSLKVKNDFEIVTSKKPYEFSKNIFYLGEIPRINNFEKGMYQDDKMLDDSAIAIKTNKGTVLISGCSHSGICNICEHAKNITGQKLYSVIGGFHLFETDEKAVKGTIEYFKKEKIKYLFPMHCVDQPTMAKLYDNFKFKKYSSGDTIEL